jgi:D-tagatose-bisphosphate aldolase class II non-catalytic subunit
MQNYLLELARSHHQGRAEGIASICSAHPTVIRATLRHAKSKSQPVLIEATCNQVNQFGGYTGMTPKDFVAFVLDIASSEAVAKEQIIFGGDHLGPNPWRNEAAETALSKASDLVAAYVGAGFTKIHIDASMGCAGEPAALDNATVAKRAAVLCKRAEDEAMRLKLAPPVYVLGTEVPIPGGADHALTTIEPTSARAAEETIEIHRREFADAGLGEAFSRVVAFVVQPGVEFGSDNVLPYQPEASKELSGILQKQGSIVFEAHSTDYQSEEALSALVQEGFPILKVGPELTFAYREALYRLDQLACEISADHAAFSLRQVLEAVMLEDPRYWRPYYHGDDVAERLQRHYSYSDRIRYYWNEPRVAEAVARLLVLLKSQSISETLIRQFLPQAQLSGSFEPQDILISAVDDVLFRYDRATGALERSS